MPAVRGLADGLLVPPDEARRRRHLRGRGDGWRGRVGVAGEGAQILRPDAVAQGEVLERRLLELPEGHLLRLWLQQLHLGQHARHQLDERLEPLEEEGLVAAALALEGGVAAEQTEGELGQAARR